MADAHEHTQDEGHSHSGGGGHSHSHGVTASSNQRWLVVALLINVVFMVVEVVVGLIANSVALLSDAAHMVTDAGAIGLALVALRLAQRPPSGRFTFGYKRGEILSAQTNGAVLLVLAAIIGFEAIRRIGNPPEVDGSFVIVVGLVGALANGGAAFALMRANRESLNVEGAFLHNLADLYSSLAAAVAGVVIVATGFNAADGIAALTVCFLMLYGGWGLLRDSGRILLEGTPKGLDAGEIGNALAGHSGVSEVHDLHVWEVTSGFPALSAHVIVPAGEDCHHRRRELQRLLTERFAIAHATLQVEHERAEQLLEVDTTVLKSKQR
ncbi:MAG: cation diffusion facilitator family transporter [Thermoleophilaceae bacterium]